MSIQDKILQDMKASMKSGDKLVVQTLRMVRSQFKNAAIASGEELTEEDLMVVLSKEAKRRKDSQTMYLEGGRQDLADQEARELEIISSYLPKAMSEDELSQIIDEAVTATGAQSMKEMGKVMGFIMPKVKGKADGTIIQEMVRKKLG